MTDDLLDRMLVWIASACRVERACRAIGRPVYVHPERRVVRWYAWGMN